MGSIEKNFMLMQDRLYSFEGVVSSLFQNFTNACCSLCAKHSFKEMQLAAKLSSATLAKFANG